MGKFDDLPDERRRGLERMEQVYGFDMTDGAGDFFGYTADHLFADIWSRPGLSLGVKSLAMIAMMAAANRPAELRVHLKGALKNGCTPEEVREVLLLVALYCGIPAANEAHRAAMDVLAEEKT